MNCRGRQATVTCTPLLSTAGDTRAEPLPGSGDVSPAGLPEDEFRNPAADAAGSSCVGLRPWDVKHV